MQEDWEKYSVNPDKGNNEDWSKFEVKKKVQSGVEPSTSFQPSNIGGMLSLIDI